MSRFLSKRPLLGLALILALVCAIAWLSSCGRVPTEAPRVCGYHQQVLLSIHDAQGALLRVDTLPLWSCR